MVQEDIDLGIIIFKFHMQTFNSGNSFQKKTETKFNVVQWKAISKIQKVEKEILQKINFSVKKVL